MKKEFPFLTAEDDALLQKNPDRGYRTGTSLDVKTLSEAGDYAAMKEAAGRHIDEKMPDARDSTTVAQNYLYISGYNQGPIDDKGLEAITAFYDAQIQRGVKGQPRFIYSHDMPDPVHDAPQDVILHHIDQLAPVVAACRDGINAFQMCFIGAWGEWHSEYYPLDKRVIGEAVMEKLVLPNGLYAQMRLPAYKNILRGTPGYQRIGIENDAFFGKIPAGYGGAPVSGTGGLDEGSEQWAQLVKEAAYTPQEGELFWQYWFDENPQVVVDGKKAVEQLSEHRFSTLSFLHSYLERRDDENTMMARWKRQPMTEEWLRETGILYDPHWFRDSRGGSVSRNIFDFVRDHLGYRLALTGLETDGDLQPGGVLHVKLSLVNYGFAAAFQMESGFVLLDREGRAVVDVPCGNPETWYNRNPDNYFDGAQLTHTLETDLTLPSGGAYRLAFDVKNSLGQSARLCNRLEVENGCHVLCELTI